MLKHYSRSNSTNILLHSSVACCNHDSIEYVLNTSPSIPFPREESWFQTSHSCISILQLYFIKIIPSTSELIISIYKCNSHYK